MMESEAASRPDENDKKTSWWIRLGWLMAIWAMSVLALGIVAFVIKKFMNAAGMSS